MEADTGTTAHTAELTLGTVRHSGWLHFYLLLLVPPGFSRSVKCQHAGPQDGLLHSTHTRLPRPANVSLAARPCCSSLQDKPDMLVIRQPVSQAALQPGSRDPAVANQPSLPG